MSVTPSHCRAHDGWKEGIVTFAIHAPHEYLRIKKKK